MELIKETWKKTDGECFQNFLKGKSHIAKIEWTKRILATNMPVLALKTDEIKLVIKELEKGNIESFLNLNLFDYYENTVIYGHLLTKLPFEKMKFYLEILSSVADNWATCDSIPFKNIKKIDKPKLFSLSREFIKSSLPFKRRIGIKILFEFSSEKDKVNEIFEILNTFESENHYYVNMINAWLVCELFIKQKDKTWQFLKSNKLNTFTVNKAISKCRDSFRVTMEEKEQLLNFKK